MLLPRVISLAPTLGIFSNFSKIVGDRVSLFSPGWPQFTVIAQVSLSPVISCVCLPSTKITDIYHHTWLPGFSVVSGGMGRDQDPEGRRRQEDVTSPEG